MAQIRSKLVSILQNRSLTGASFITVAPVANCAVVTGSPCWLSRLAQQRRESGPPLVGLAECHLLDIYDPYAWRYRVKQDPTSFGRPLDPEDGWQERYILGPDAKSPELRL